MKKIQYILSSMALGVCILLSGCQDLDEPTRTVPVIGEIGTSNISATSITLTGSVYGSYDKCYFLLSTSQDMSNAEEYSANVIGGNASTTIYELRPNTTYYYVLVVTKGDDETRGKVSSATTSDNIFKISNVTFGNGESGEMPTEIGTCIWRMPQQPISDYVNAKLSKNGDSWEIPYSWEMISNGNYVMYAYAPYDESLTENENFYSGGRIPVATYKYNAIDYLYGQSNEFNVNQTTANVTMHHALAKVVFKFKLAEYYQNDNAVITDITLSNQKDGGNILPTTGYINLRNGGFETDGYSYSEPLKYSTEISVNKATTTEVVIMSIPTMAYGTITITITIDGHTYSQPLTINRETAWKKGQQYSFDATVNESELVLGNVEVEAWHNNNSGDITVNN